MKRKKIQKIKRTNNLERNDLKPVDFEETMKKIQHILGTKELRYKRSKDTMESLCNTIQILKSKKEEIKQYYLDLAGIYVYVYPTMYDDCCDTKAFDISFGIIPNNIQIPIGKIIDPEFYDLLEKYKHTGIVQMYSDETGKDAANEDNKEDYAIYVEKINGLYENFQKISSTANSLIGDINGLFTSLVSIRSDDLNRICFEISNYDIAKNYADHDELFDDEIDDDIKKCFDEFYKESIKRIKDEIEKHVSVDEIKYLIENYMF